MGSSGRPSTSCSSSSSSFIRSLARSVTASRCRPFCLPIPSLPDGRSLPAAQVHYCPPRCPLPVCPACSSYSMDVVVVVVCYSS